MWYNVSSSSAALLKYHASCGGQVMLNWNLFWWVAAVRWNPFWALCSHVQQSLWKCSWLGVINSVREIVQPLIMLIDLHLMPAWCFYSRGDPNVCYRCFHSNWVLILPTFQVTFHQEQTAKCEIKGAGEVRCYSPFNQRRTPPCNK